MVCFVQPNMTLPSWFLLKFLAHFPFNAIGISLGKYVCAVLPTTILLWQSYMMNIKTPAENWKTAKSIYRVEIGGKYKVS